MAKTTTTTKAPKSKYDTDTSARYDAQGRPMVECAECGKYAHRIDIHASKEHGLDKDEYQKKYPGKPMYSEAALERIAASQPAVMAPETPKKELKIHMNFGVSRLVIRSEEKLTDQERALVPVHDENYSVGDAEKSLWEDMALAVSCRDNVFVYGPTGCGKTTAILELAAMINQPCYRVNCSGEIRVADFVGDKTVELDAASGQSVIRWVDGILPMCMRNGWWLILDELDAAPPHVLFALQAVLEKGGKLVLTQNEGEIVEPSKTFRVFATANTNGRGDETGAYSGTQLLNESFLDRFGMVLCRDYPDADTEASILEARGVTAKQAVDMVEVAKLVRDAGAADTVSCTFSTRRLISWAEKTVRYGDAKRAAQVVILNRLSKDEAKFVGGLIQRVLG